MSDLDELAAACDAAERAIAGGQSADELLGRIVRGLGRALETRSSVRAHEPALFDALLLEAQVARERETERVVVERGRG